MERGRVNYIVGDKEQLLEYLCFTPAMFDPYSALPERIKTSRRRGARFIEGVRWEIG